MSFHGDKDFKLFLKNNYHGISAQESSLLSVLIWMFFFTSDKQKIPKIRQVILIVN